MVRRIQEPFGKAGLIVAIVALVAAVGGSAIAATNATDSAKRNHKAKKNKKKQSKGVTVAQVRKIAKQEAKKFANSSPGSAGPQGPAGPAGANGQDGQNGDNGDPGTNGTSASATPYTGAECEEASGEAGVKVTTTAGDSYICNGKDGTFDPSGFTQTGTWNYLNKTTAGVIDVFAGFSIPLENSAEAHYINKDGKEMRLNIGALAIQEIDSTHCPGTAAEPAADPGHLCVYAAKQTGTLTTALASPGNVSVHSGNFSNPGTEATGGLQETSQTGLAGFHLRMTLNSGSSEAWGTWAITGE